ncbi:MAG: hypothetical protein LBQ66_05010 [Planctomycetaceae bacterium]|nr:hypothetical protein [Planctomycetaceae bacterium]
MWYTSPPYWLRWWGRDLVVSCCSWLVCRVSLGACGLEHDVCGLELTNN